MGNTHYNILVHMVVEDKNENKSLLMQVRSWMDRVSPGVSPQIRVLMETRSSELMFDFVEGKERSNSYKSVNVGFGITYVLPVVIALLTAEKGDVVIIENPEAHIHPAGQRMLGELIARVGAGGVQVYKDEENDYKHTFKSLNINSDGKMSSWPEGFFDEWEKALIELL